MQEVTNLPFKLNYGYYKRSFNITEREKANKDCARMFYTGALSFNFVKNLTLGDFV